MNRFSSRPARRRRSSGFTLAEVLVALAVMTMLMLGTMDLYIGSLRMASRTDAEIGASQSAARVMRHITEITREANWFSLPDSTDNGFFAANLTTAGMGSYSASPQSNFISTSGSNSADTAMFLEYPATAPAIQVVDTAGTSQTVSTLYDPNGVTTQYLLIYRSDSAGVPAPGSGTYLWEIGTDNGVAVNKALISGVDGSWDSVQFVRPRDSSGTVEPYNVEIKIACSQYSAINGQQTSESTGGANTTHLVGKCVALRNHELSLTHEQGASSTSTTLSGNKFVPS